MESFINTSKELFYGDRYFREHVAPENFDYRAHKKELSPYFAQYGFKVSMMYNDFTARNCCKKRKWNILFGRWWNYF